MQQDGYTHLFKQLQQLNTGTSNDMLQIFAFAFESKRFKKGAIISQRGVPAHSVFFVNKGCVRLYYIREQEEITAAFSFEGSFTGPCKSMMLQIVNKQIFEAFEDCELLMLSRTSYFNVLSKYAELFKVKSVIAERIMFEQEDIISFFLSFSPQERYIYLLENQPELFKRIPQLYIASLIGISPVSLSRIRRRTLQ